MKKRGPKPLGHSVELRTTVQPEVAEALDLLVSLGEYSKATYVRLALINLLSTWGGIYPEVGAVMRPTASRGRLARSKAVSHD